MPSPERKAAEVANWQRQQVEERAELARLLATVESVPETYNRRGRVYDTIKGLRWRIADRQARLDTIAAKQACEAAGRAALASGIVALVRLHGGFWRGSASDLMTVLPTIAPNATQLAKLLGEEADNLAATGVRVDRWRKAGSGRRMLDLRRVNPEEAATARCDADGRESGNVVIASSGTRPDAERGHAAAIPEAPTAPRAGRAEEVGAAGFSENEAALAAVFGAAFVLTTRRPDHGGCL